MARRLYEYVIPFLYANRIKRDFQSVLNNMDTTWKKDRKTIDEYALVMHKQQSIIDAQSQQIKAGVDAARALEDAAMGVVQACQGEVIIIEGDKDDPEPEMHQKDPDLNKIRKAAEIVAVKATRASSLLLGIIEPTKEA